MLSHAVALKRDAVGVVNDPVEDGVGDGRVTDDFMMPSSSIVYCVVRGGAEF